MRDFLDALFRPGESTCFAKTPYATQVALAHPDIPQMADRLRNGHEELFFSINPLRGSRADANVTAWRNFLIELDGGTIEEQLHYIEELGMPWTACTYSGGKSLHFIIALEESLPDEQTYRRIGDRLHAAVERADHSTKNPSRLSRLPGVIRPDTGKEQRLVRLNERIALEDLQAWLSRFPAPKQFTPRKGMWRAVEPIYEATKRLLIYGPGSQDGGRYVRIRDASFNLCGAGWSVDQVVEALLKPTGGDYDLDEAQLHELVEQFFQWKERQDASRAGKGG